MLRHPHNLEVPWDLKEQLDKGTMTDRLNNQMDSPATE